MVSCSGNRKTCLYPEKQGGFPKQPDEARNHAGTRGQCCITKFPARGRKHPFAIFLDVQDHRAALPNSPQGDCDVCCMKIPYRDGMSR